MKLLLLFIFGARSFNAIVGIGKVRPIISPEAGAWHVLGWLTLAALVVLG